MDIIENIKTKLKNIIQELKSLSAKAYNDSFSFFESLFHDKEGQDEIKLYKILFNIIVISISISTILFLINIPLSRSWEQSGQFGDFFGGILNPILTFFTLFGLIATIIIQRRELRLSRSEYEKTAEALNTQAIESTFFNLLNLHHKISDELKFDVEVGASNKSSSIFHENLPIGFYRPTELKSFRGRSCFEAIITYLTENCKTPVSIVDKYKDFQENNNHILGHYFRNLYQALKVIDSYEDEFLSVNQKNKYASILRAQLSSNELALLFLNCLNGICDKGQFRNLLVKYSMLEHLPITRVETLFYLSHKVIADRDMMLQYHQNEEIKIELGKYFGGAFGRNTCIPYNLQELNHKSLNNLK